MNKKTITILLVVLVVIIVGGVGGYFVYTNLKESKTTGTEWGDTYYAYMKSATNENSNKEDYGLKDNMENTKIQFIDVGEDNPIMTMTYDFEGNSYVNIYATKGEHQVNKIVYQDPATIEFLYDIENKSYDWYLHTENETEDSYKKIYTMLENPNQNNEAEYTIKKDDATTQNTISGETITLSKFDETFIKPEIESNTKIDFTENIDMKVLKNNITKSVETYKKQEEIITEEIETAIENKIAEIEEIKQQIETAKTEIAQKKAEEQAKAEEEKKKAEEETKKKMQDENARIVEEGKKIYENANKAVSEASNNLSEAEKAAFNAKFTSYEGSRRGTQVKALINAVKANNNSGDRQVSLTGDVKQTTDVVSVKNYIVKCNYGSDGFINSISITNN